jgi:flagellar biosynthetic protein FliR
MEISSRICVTAVILASPVLVVTLLLNVALALISRVVPSVNLFGIGLGLLTFTGMVSLAFEGEAILVFVQRSIETLPSDMWNMSGMTDPGT